MINNEAQIRRGTKVQDNYSNKGVVVMFTPGNTPCEDIGGVGYVFTGGGQAVVAFENGNIDYNVPEAIIRSQTWTIFDDIATEEEIKQLEAKVRVKAAESARQQRLNSIEKGKKILEGQIPEKAKAVIVACYETDDSDTMTDYFATKKGPIHILAWSTHTRDLFSEMRRAAAVFEQTKHLATAPDTNKNGQPKTESNKDYWHPYDEHREKYSMGKGYYLKAEGGFQDGWTVYKDLLSYSMDEVFHAAGCGRYLVPAKPAAVSQLKEGRAVTETTVTRNEDKGGIEIRFAEKPDTAIREQLKTNGFRWHRKLKFWYAKYTEQRFEFANSLKD